MSNPRFIKFIPSEESDYLQENHPNAFLLLCLIAKRARRISGQPDGLEIGEAHIGDYEKAGLNTRGQYRHALEILIGRAHIKKVETCRTRKKATTGATTEGTKVKLLRSDVWDINSDCSNHHDNHRTTTEQPPNNHEQERTRKNKKEKRTITTPPNPQTHEIAVADVVFFDSLLKKDDFPIEKKKKWILSEQDKLLLLRNHSVERITLAFEYASSPTIHIKTTLIQLLMWHCNQQKPPISHEKEKNQKDDFMKENDKISLELFEQCKPISKYDFFDFLKEKNIMKIGTHDRIPDEISVFEHPTIFRNLLESSLRKFGMWKSKNSKIEPFTQEIAMEN